MDLRYPIGPDVAPTSCTAADRAERMAAIAALPQRLREAVAGLSEGQLDTPYRPGGWTVRQVVHHLADSHANAFVRLKLALTESNPTIKPYDEATWAQLPDSRLPVEVSLQLLDALHQRWMVLWHALTPAQFARTLQHPERGPMSVDDVLATYAWHGRHHTAHITELRKRERW